MAEQLNLNQRSRIAKLTATAVATFLASFLMVVVPVGSSSGAPSSALKWVESGPKVVKNPSGYDAVSCVGKHCVVIDSSIARGVGWMGYSPIQVFATSNSGSTWTKGTIPANVVNETSVVCVTTLNCLMFAALGDQQVMLGSRNGGQSWTVLKLPLNFRPISSSCISQTNCVVVGLDPNGKSEIFRTNGLGTMWRKLGASPVTPGTLDMVACSSATSCIVVSTDHTAMFATSDGGAKWRAVSTPNGFSLTGLIYCPAANQCVMVGDAMTAVSVNGGVSWKKSPLPADVSLYGVSCLASTNCVAVGDTSRNHTYSQSAVVIYQSSNGGVSWKQDALATKYPGGLMAVSCTTLRCTVVGHRISSNSASDLLFSGS